MSPHSRREFVKTALTAGAGALLPAVNAAGQNRRPGRIDVHHHCRTAIQGGAGRGPGSDWSPAKSREQMDKFGIATSIISATVSLLVNGVLSSFPDLRIIVNHSEALKSLVGSSQILFGTDYPFGSAAATAGALRQSGLGENELRDIDRNNILRIFPGLIS